MVWTAWSNGNKRTSGGGYGFRISRYDRDNYFDRAWNSVLVKLPFQDEDHTIEIPISRPGFWTGRCQELRSKRVGDWLLTEGHAPWPAGSPPKFTAKIMGRRSFAVHPRS